MYGNNKISDNDKVLEIVKKIREAETNIADICKGIDKDIERINKDLSNMINVEKIGRMFSNHISRDICAEFTTLKDKYRKIKSELTDITEGRKSMIEIINDEEYTGLLKTNRHNKYHQRVIALEKEANNVSSQFKNFK